MLTVAAIALAIGAACNHRRDDDGTIKPAPEESPRPAPTGELTPPVPPPAAPEAVPNPLAMPLKHDGPVAAAPAASGDPCALVDPKGPLAMKLRHDRPNAPGQRNPLCMPLK